MDPRHPQHPFSRSSTTAAPYSHTPFQPTAGQPPFQASHPQSTPPLYTEHQRRASENQYYQQQPPYPRDGASVSSTGHSRHPSSSSIGHGTSVSRNIPPSSPQPQQPQAQAQAPAHTHPQHSHAYAPPPLTRGPPAALGPSLSFSANRDLPSLASIHRPSSGNSSSMSISSMLGGPSPTTREAVQPTTQYSAPPSLIASAPPPTSYTAPLHTSPRIATAGSEYGRYRRPQTPEHQRSHESQGIRDHRASSASSPPRGAPLSTPESSRYGTPQYSQRNSQNAQVPPHEERREQYPMRVPNPNSVVPQRPSSQPTSFNGPHRLPESSRLLGDVCRQEPSYARPPGYSERDDIAFRERQRHEDELRREQERERERERDRDRERDRERERMERREHPNFSGKPGQLGNEPPAYSRQYAQQQGGSYNGPADPREPGSWVRPRPDQNAPEHPPLPHSQTTSSVGYEFPRTTAQSYNSHPVYAPSESRYTSSSYSQSVAPQQRTTPLAQYEGSVQDRPKVNLTDQTQQTNIHGTPQGPYRIQPSHLGRPTEELQQIQQRGYLGVQQEINRKGRSSPFPQAVQGAQGQISVPAGEPSIKNEFGKMFSGIGSGVGSMSSVGTSSSGMQTPFSNVNQLRREDLDGLISQDIAGENGGHKILRASSRGGGRRRKLREEDGKCDDDSSTGRHTPSNRGSKRVKSGNHQVGTSHRHSQVSNLRQEEGENTSPPSQANSGSLKHAGSTQAVPSPTSVECKISVPHHHHINRHHHHHHTHHVTSHHRSVPAALTIPKPKQIVRSQLVLDSVAHLPRHHLGHGIYETRLEVPPSFFAEHSSAANRGFASTPRPLPRFEGRENCTYTIRIPRVHLTPISRQELTSRRSVWGTDIYSDDSDIIAACIHSGWIRGEWAEDIDVSLLGLSIESPDIEKDNSADNDTGKDEKAENESKLPGNDIVFTKPPPRGPMMPLEDHDLHVTVLVLPALEKYASTVRWGIKSREWSNTHDGLSFMIIRIKWVIGVDTVKEPRGKARRMRMKLALEQSELLEEERWRSLLTNGNGYVQPREGVIRESFVRSEGPGPGQMAMLEISNLGTGSWWKAKGNGKKAPKGTSGDVEEIKIKHEDGAPSDEKAAQQSDADAVTVLAPKS